MSEPEVVDVQRDMEELVIQNRVLAREVITLTNSHDTIVNALLRFQGLLAQFFSPSVRSDFLAGKFSVTVFSTDVLSSLDVFRTIMLPYPSGIGSRSARTADVIEFVSKLLSKDTSEPEREGMTLPHRQTFCEWRNYLNILIASPHWAVRSQNILASDAAFDTAGVSDNVLGSQWEGFVNTSDRAVPKVERGKLSSTLRGDVRNGVPLKLRGRMDDYQTDYDATTEDSGDGASDCGSFGVAHLGKPKREKRVTQDGADLSLASAMQYLRMPKEVVPPSKFDLKAGTSLRRFLDQYERYFSTKFDGTDRDKAQHLQQFLQGSVRSAYDAIGGSLLRYTKLKPKLLEWYNAEKVNVCQKKFNEFQHIKMAPNESSTVYALRLERIAMQAFPGSPSDRERHLRQKFRQTVTTALRKKFDSAASNLAILGERQLTWVHMKRVAESHDRLTREQQFNSSILDDSDEDKAISVWYSRPNEHLRADSRDISPKTRPVSKYEREGARPKTTFSRQTVFKSHRNTPGSPPVNREVSRNVPACDWCGRTGHFERNCWAKHGQCTLCGDKTHKRYDCRGRDSSQRSHVPPLRSLGGGGHPERNCGSPDDTNLNF